MKFRKYYSVVSTRWLLLIDILIANLCGLLAMKGTTTNMSILWQFASAIWHIIFVVDVIFFVKRWLNKRKSNPTIENFNKALEKSEEK